MLTTNVTYKELQAIATFGHVMNYRYVSDSTVYELLEAKIGKGTDFSAPVFSYESYQDSFYTTPDMPYHARMLGDKRYELTNHLGNVLAVVSDRKIAVEDQGNPGTVEYYEADMVSARDYYPFGMIQPGRSVSAGEYRYGFNAQEMDNEWASTGSHIAFEYRIQDTRLGRFLSTDPMASEFAWNSPYAFAENRVIMGIDWKGLAWKPVTTEEDEYIGFEWEPDNAYDDDGNLRDGYYSQAVGFFEKSDAFDSDNRFNLGSAQAFIYTSEGEVLEFDATTFSADPESYATVEAGNLYEGRIRNYKDSPAILLSYNGGLRIPVEGDINPAFPNQQDDDIGAYATGIFVHWAYGNEPHTTGYNRFGENPASRGCILACGNRGEFQQNFMTNFDNEETIGVTIFRFGE